MARPRADNYVERQQSILDVAASIFAEHGFNGTSIASLAEACGVSKALLYHYYDSKEALLYDMLLVHCKLLSSTAANAVKLSSKPEEQLHNVITSLLELYMGSRDKHVVLLHDLHCLPKEQQKAIKEEERRVLQVIKDLLKKLRPDLTPSETTSFTMYLMGAVNWTYTWFKPQGSVSAAKYAEIVTTTFLHGFKEQGRAEHSLL